MCIRDRLDAILFAHEEIKKIVEFIEEIVREVGRPKQEVVLYKPLDEIDQAVREYAAPKMKEAIRTPDKLERLENMDAVEAETKEHFEEIYPEGARDIDSVPVSYTHLSTRGQNIQVKINNYNMPQKENISELLDKCVLLNTYLTSYFLECEYINGFDIYYRIDCFDDKSKMYGNNFEPTNILYSQAKNSMFVSELVLINTEAGEKVEKKPYSDYTESVSYTHLKDGTDDLPVSQPMGNRVQGQHRRPRHCGQDRRKIACARRTPI